MRVSPATAGGCILALFLIILLAAADAGMFQDAEYTPLYEATLEQAYSRFRQTDQRVPAGGPSDPAFDPVNEPIAPAGGGNPSPIAGTPASPARPAAPVYHDHEGTEIVQGNQYLANRQYDEALGSFGVHMEKYPSCSLIQHRVGDTLRQQGRLDEAIDAYRETLKHRSTYYCAHEHIGDILSSQGKTEEAEAAFGLAVAGYREQMQQEGAAGTSARFQLSKFFVDHDRNLEEAVELAEAATKASPTNVAYLLPLLAAYEKLDRVQQAINTIDQIILLRPDLAPQYQKQRARLAQHASPGTVTDDDRQGSP